MKLKYKLSTILVVILLIGVLGFSLFYFTPDLVKVFNLKKKLNQRQNNFENLQRELNSNKSLLETKLEGELAEEKILQAIPYQMQTNQFLIQLKKLTSKNKLKLNKYVPQNTIQKQKYYKLPILIETTGDYTALNHFHKELKNLNRLVTIEKIKIFHKNEKLKSELVLVIYSLKCGDGE